MIKIRAASPSDIRTLIDFQCKLALESEGIELDKTLLEKGLQTLLEDAYKGMYYIAEDGSEPVGCHMITYEWSDWRNGVVWWLQSVYVKESHRSKGVFRNMYNNLMDVIAKDSSVKGLRLYVDKSNKKAQHVYEAMGMNGEHYTVFEWMK